MASNREERERLRQERLATERSGGGGDRSRLIAGYFVAALLTLAVVGGLVVVLLGGDDETGPKLKEGVDCPAAHVQPDVGTFAHLNGDCRTGTTPPALALGDLEQASANAGCENHLGLRDEGSNHFTDENKKTYKDYGTAPPTSGDHYGVPTETASGPIADGAYSNTPLASRIVHSLEHGRVEIEYSPDLSEEDQLALKGIFDEDPEGMLMFPNPNMPYKVAVVAWTNYVGCKEYDPGFLDVIRDFRDRFRGNGPENVPFQLN